MNMPRFLRDALARRQLAHNAEILAARTRAHRRGFEHALHRKPVDFSFVGWCRTVGSDHWHTDGRESERLSQSFLDGYMLGCQERDRAGLMEGATLPQA
ncbi:MAG: hypothetical protein RSP_17620 [Rhodanobacter sp.]